MYFMTLPGAGPLFAVSQVNFEGTGTTQKQHSTDTLYHSSAFPGPFWQNPLSEINGIMD